MNKVFDLNVLSAGYFTESGEPVFNSARSLFDQNTTRFMCSIHGMAERVS